MNLTNAYSIITYAIHANIQLRAENGRLVVNAPRELVSLELQECLTKHKQELLQALNYHGFTLVELKYEAAEGWEEIKNNQAALIAYSQILYEWKLMFKSEVPPRFTAKTFCMACNKQVPVPPALVNGGKVLSCMWNHIH